MRPSKPTPATPLSVATQFSQLPELAMADIKSLWQRLFHAANPTHNRQFLERRIAYKLQEIEFRKVDPGLLDRNKRRIENLIETGKVKTRDPDYRPVAGTMLKGAAHPVQGWCAMGGTLTRRPAQSVGFLYTNRRHPVENNINQLKLNELLFMA
ncbi:MAG: DUF2924 domain-containing protein [Ilumatobacteraceae bacterium]|nr:DUF2924 domain-containing protein [Ilumatobacteraceae bacterium]